MRILIVSYYFPPYNKIGSVRVGKIAKYLVRLGHEVRVVTARDQENLPLTLPVEVPLEGITYTRWWNLNWPVAALSSERGWAGKAGSRLKRFSFNARQRLVRLYHAWYKAYLHIPDERVGWYPFALAAANKVLRSWRPDVIYASGLPMTALMVARKLSRQWNIPWIGELRDLWRDNSLYPKYPGWRRALDARIERRVLSSAAGLVTVAEPLADILRGRYQLPTEVIFHGFDAEDYLSLPTTDQDPEQLRIVYTGTFHADKRDPSPLFRALRAMGPRAASIRVALYGPHLHYPQEIADAHGVTDLVELHGPVPRHEALMVQRQADLLLALLWTDTAMRGMYSGKLFEYMGARRPILGVGPSVDLPARLIRERQLGIVSDDPDEIAVYLDEQLANKAQTGSIPDLPEENCAAFTYENSARQLAAFLSRVIGAEAGTSPGSIGEMGKHAP